MTNRVSAGVVLFAVTSLFAACTSGEDPGNAGTAGTSATGAAGTGSAGTSATGSAGTSATGAAGTSATGSAGTSATGTAGTNATGSAGTGAAGTGTAGAGAAGTGAAGAGTAGSGGLPGAVKSAGCGMAAGQALMTYVKYTIMVGTAPRDYWIWLPANYDPNRAYPTVFIGPGCGGRGNQGIPMQMASGDKAILIGLDASPAVTGRDCFMTESAMSPEIPYFDATVMAVEAKLCVDKSHIFLEGFSSGSWLTNLLGCARGNIIKAQGNSSGCQPPIPNPCTGPIAMMGVTNDPDPNNSYQCGMANRDRIAKLNGCTTQTMPYTLPAGVMAAKGGVLECTQFVGCMPGKPVVWCRTTNLGHNDGSITGVSTFGFWDFWMKLP